MTEEYEDIINMSRPKLTGRPRMSMMERVALFSSFDALEDYDDAIDEAEFMYESQIE